MSRYLEIAEEVMQQIRERRRQKKTGDGLPWPGYNDGKQFRCDLCHTYFDTSVGFAKHQVNGCAAPNKATEATAKTLSRCAACGSYALYREKDGRLTCQTCG
jgi:hypothetical protein